MQAFKIFYPDFIQINFYYWVLFKITSSKVIRLDDTNAIYRSDSCYPTIEYALS